MKNRKQRTVLAVALLIGATCACVHPAQANDTKVQGKVNAAGELHNADGATIGKVVMTKPGVGFDIEKMTIQQDGKVLDTSGEEVGRMVLAPDYSGPIPSTTAATAASEPLGDRIIDAPVVSESAPAAVPTGTGESRVAGKVNSCGEFRDANGKMLGKVMMHDAGLGWDIETMTVRNDGIVVDASGKEVGKVQMRDPNQPEETPLSLPVGTSAPPVSPIAPAASSALPPAALAPLDDPVPPAQPLGAKIEGSINSDGEVYSQGKIAAHVVMNDADTAFDIETMTVKNDGSVVDDSGAKVGRLVFDKDFSVKVGPAEASASVVASPGPGVMEYTNTVTAPPENSGISSYSESTTSTSTPGSSVSVFEAAKTTPSASVSTVDVTTPPAVGTAVSTYAETTTTTLPGAGVRNYTGPSTPGSGVSEYRSSSTSITPSGVVNSQSTTSVTAETSKSSNSESPSAVMGIREEDLTSRRTRVEQRIATELAEGRITATQAETLRSELETASRAASSYKRDGILADREVRELYRYYDIAMYNLDRYLARNARKAIGLRTR